MGQGMCKPKLLRRAWPMRNDVSGGSGATHGSRYNRQQKRRRSGSEDATSNTPTAHAPARAAPPRRLVRIVQRPQRQGPLIELEPAAARQ